MKKCYMFFTIAFLCSTLLFSQTQVEETGLKQVETSIAVNPNNANVIAAAAIELIPPNRQCVVWVSTNNGSNWIRKKTVSNVMDPVVEFDNYGSIIFCYLDKIDLEIYIIKSSDLGSNWSSPVKISSAPSRGADKECMLWWRGSIH